MLSSTSGARDAKEIIESLTSEEKEALIHFEDFMVSNRYDKGPRETQAACSRSSI